MSKSKVDNQAKSELYIRLKNMGNRPMDCHICHSGLAGKAGNLFCPECREAVQNEDPRHTRARSDFFKHLGDEDEKRPQAGQRDEFRSVRLG